MNSRDPVDVVRRAGGIIRRSELLDVVTRGALDSAIRAGALGRHGRSSIALPGIASDAAAAHRVDGVLGGLSAARAWGWKVKAEPPAPIVIVPRNRHHDHQGVTVRRRDLMPDAIQGDRLTRVATVIDCARTLPFDAALAVADSALRERRIT